METVTLFLILTTLATSTAQPTLCRTSCGPIPISYPFGIDPGCGSPYYHNLLKCNPSNDLLVLRTPSGSYPVHFLSYSDPHLIVSDLSMFACSHFTSPIPAPPFALDTSTRLRISSKNDFLFFNCSPESVIIQPKPAFCDRFPERCDSVCDSAGYLCRNLPGCPEKLALTETSCCSYYPKASESVRMMLRHCGGYASLYWRIVGDHMAGPYDEVPEYGIRVDFDVPVTTKCQMCRERGGGICGYDTGSRGFVCLCDEGNVTTYCGDGSLGHRTPAGVIAGTTTVVSITGLASAGILVWYLRKMRSNKVTCGVQTTENRLF